MEPNFSGYVTRYDIKCTDGRTIKPGSFAHMDGAKIPLVYQHNHTDVNQVLGHVILSAKEDGMWGDAFLNGTPSALNADLMVKHGDIDKFSIWAKDLVEHGLDVMHGEIQEASLVLSGANSGATIFNVLQHSGIDPDDLMVVGGEIKHDDTEEKPAPVDAPPIETDKPADVPPAESKTQAEVLATLNDEQQLAVNAFVDDVAKEAVTEALTAEAEIEHDNLSEKGTSKMSRNVFDGSTKTDSPQLKHSDVQSILKHAKGPDGAGGSNATSSLRELVRSQQGKELMHASDYGIENIEVLFPDAQQLMRTPTFVDRRQDWVKTFMNGTSKSPFSRVKTVYADITADEARARGYIKANQKVDEVFPVFKRETGPAWVYKRQKLDRQDIIDVESFDVVAWLKVEMRGKLDEEIARAALFGDGRPTMVNGEMNPDKIQDPGAASLKGDGIRAIVNDHDLYVSRFDVQIDVNARGTGWNVLLDEVTEASEHYMGSGNKTAFVTYRTASRLLTIRDDFGHRVYRNLSEVAGDMDVSSIVRVPTELMPTDVLAIVLDLSDYNFGTSRGGEVTLFDDFDIDFNQYKYLIEAYLSGALTIPYCAQIFRAVGITAVEIVPTKPAQVGNVVTIPTQTGVVFTNATTGTTLSQGSTVTLTEEVDILEVEAKPSSGYFFGDDRDETDTFVFEYVPA